MSRQVLTRQQSLALTSWVALLRAHAMTTRDLSGKLFTDHGLTINDYEALLRLSHAEGQRMRRVDLADELVLTASGVTRLLDGLERAGYVEKGSCESDARVTYAVLTRRGRDKLAEASSSHIAQVQGLFEEHLTNDELATLADLLSRLPGVGQADGGDCSPS
jgi:DNA-binding MarR family transcriptional regulator